MANFRVKAPFVVYPKANVLAALVLVKVRVFTKEFPAGKVNLAPVYFECQHLGATR